MADQIYRVRDPSGTMREIKGPAGASDEQVIAQAKALFGGGADAGEKQDAVTAAINKSPTAGLLDAGLSLASGAVAAPVSGIAGLVQGAKNFISPGMPAADRIHQVQGALTVEPKTTIGKGLVKAVSYPFEKLAEGANVVGEKTAEGTGSPAAGAGVNTALQAVPLILGRVMPAGEGAASMAKRNALKLKNEQVDAGTMAAKDAGYTLPPTQANPSLLNQLFEGIAGKIKTAQGASLKNQDVTNGLVRKALGVADEAPLSVESLANVRREAGQAYERVRGSGTVTADPVYAQTLDSIAEPYLRASKDFPDAARTDIISAVDAVRRPSFDAGSAVDQIRILRGKADQAYAGKDKSLGGAYKEIANALEEQLGRHLEASGATPEALADFQRARKTIAQTYTVEKHLKPDGNVDAVGLGRELKRKPLTGELRTAAEFGEQFPKAAQKPERVGGVTGISPVDVGVGGLMSTIMHNPGYLALLAGRPLVRSMILSKPYQNAMVNAPNYGPSTLTRLQELAGNAQRRPGVPLLEMAEGQQQ